MSIISRNEVKKHKDRESLWMIIRDEVYDVTKFIEEHPGGEDTLLEVAGKDATTAFDDVGHSEDARELLVKYKIGKLPESETSKGKAGSGIECCRPNLPPVKRTKSCKSGCSTRCSSRTGCPGRNASSSSRPKPISTDTCSRCNSQARGQNMSPCGKTLGKESSRDSKATRFTIPPDKCYEDPTTTGAAKKIVCEDENSSLPRTKKKRKGCDSRKRRSCDACGSSSKYKYLALATALVGAIALGTLLYKKIM